MTTLLFLAGFGVQELIVILLFFLVPAVLWIWAIIDLIKAKSINDTNKIIWALVIIFVPLIGAVLYLAVGRRLSKSS
jgi:hypothetical protein